eukprot:gene7826-17290_t
MMMILVIAVGRAQTAQLPSHHLDNGTPKQPANNRAAVAVGVAFEATDDAADGRVRSNRRREWFDFFRDGTSYSEMPAEVKKTLEDEAIRGVSIASTGLYCRPPGCPPLPRQAGRSFLNGVQPNICVIQDDNNAALARGPASTLAQNLTTAATTTTTPAAATLAATPTTATGPTLMGARPSISHNAAAEECAITGKHLCSTAQLCPAGQPSVSDLPKSSATWVPVSDGGAGADEWLQYVAPGCSHSALYCCGDSNRRRDEGTTTTTATSTSFMITSTTAPTWDSHAAAFVAADVDKLLLGYTEDSVIILSDFTTGVDKVFTGLAGVRTWFEALFAYLAATDDDAFRSSLEVPDATVESGQVFLIWRAVAAGVVHATDTFIIDADGKFAVQTTTLWTAADKPLLTGESVDLNAAVPGTAAQAHWDNHLDAFATGDIEKMVLDYREDAQIIEWDFATDTKTVSAGIAGVRDLFPKYFGWAGECGDNLDVNLPTIRVTESYIYLHVTFPCAGIPLWTATFILDTDGMIVRQNIVFKRAVADVDTTRCELDGCTEGGVDDNDCCATCGNGGCHDGYVYMGQFEVKREGFWPQCTSSYGKHCGNTCCIRDVVPAAAEIETEWIGVFAVSDTSHTWSAQKVDGKYADDTMRIAFIATADPTKAGMEAVEDAGKALIAGDSCTSVTAGDAAVALGSAAPTTSGVCFELTFGTGSDSLFTLNTTGLSGVVIFGQHLPIEFEATRHYFYDSKNVDIEPVGIADSADSADDDTAFTEFAFNAGYDACTFPESVNNAASCETDSGAGCIDPVTDAKVNKSIWPMTWEAARAQAIEISKDDPLMDDNKLDYHASINPDPEKKHDTTWLHGKQRDKLLCLPGPNWYRDMDGRSNTRGIIVDTGCSGGYPGYGYQTFNPDAIARPNSGDPDLEPKQWDGCDDCSNIEKVYPRQPGFPTKVSGGPGVDAIHETVLSTFAPNDRPYGYFRGGARTDMNKNLYPWAKNLNADEDKRDQDDSCCHRKTFSCGNPIPTTPDQQKIAQERVPYEFMINKIDGVPKGYTDFAEGNPSGNLQAENCEWVNRNIFGGHFRCELVRALNAGATYRLSCEPDELELLTVPCNNRGVFNHASGDCICYVGYGGYNADLTRRDCSLKVNNWRNSQNPVGTYALLGLGTGVAVIVIVVLFRRGLGCPLIVIQILFFFIDLATDWWTNMIQLRGTFFTENAQRVFRSQQAPTMLYNASLFFCILGTVTFVAELVWVSSERIRQKRFKGLHWLSLTDWKLYWKAVSNTKPTKFQHQITIVRIFVEDLPQFIILILYFKTVIFAELPGTWELAEAQGYRLSQPQSSNWFGIPQPEPETNGQCRTGWGNIKGGQNASVPTTERSCNEGDKREQTVVVDDVRDPATFKPRYVNPAFEFTDTVDELLSITSKVDGVQSEEGYLEVVGGDCAGETTFVVAGDKVRVDGYSCDGTVRWIGTHKVDPSKGLRIMVELDEAVGKNNGTVGGIQYTANRLPNKTGILVAPAKVHQTYKKKKSASVKKSAKNESIGTNKTVPIPSPLGLSFKQNSGGDMIITKVKPGSNAEATGQVQEGMKIVSVNKNPVEGLTKKEVSNLIKISPGDRCLLEVVDPALQLSSSTKRSSSKKATKKGSTMVAPAKVHQTLIRRAEVDSDTDASTEADSDTEYPFVITDRVQVHGYSCDGTVRWVGTHKVDPSKGLRIMVELDEAIGKNNGTVGGIQYTANRLPKNTGILVRPDRAFAVAVDPATIHEWLDTVVPGYGELYAGIFEAVGMEDPADMNDTDLVDDDFFAALEDEGVDEEAIENIMLAVGFESADFDL